MKPGIAENKRERRSIRLQNYDYSQAGAYFVTICTQNRTCLFGNINDGQLLLNDTGRLVAGEWLKCAELRPDVGLDEWVLMPNHLHAILFIDGRGTAYHTLATETQSVGTARRAPAIEQFGMPVAGSLPTIIRSFKSAATKCINESRNSPGEKLWQRNYWERVVRDEKELHEMQEYIGNNPRQWELDKLHP